MHSIALVDACSIFYCARQGKILAAGNEDWSDPYSKIWVTEKTPDRYGVLNLGHSDYEVQVAVNEYGLYLDFAAISKSQGKNLPGKKEVSFGLFEEILAKCKTVGEAKAYLKRYRHTSSYYQVLIGDAYGNALIVNDDIIYNKRNDYLVSTNFNVCNLEKRSYSCKRYEIISESLISSSSISIKLFRNLLSRTRQEGRYPTQFSYIIDFNESLIYLYSYHDFENVHIINYVDEISNGFYLKDFKDLFPLNFASLSNMVEYDSMFLYETISKVKKHGIEDVLNNIQKKTTSQNPEKQAALYKNLDKVAQNFVKELWLKETKGLPFDYWQYPTNFYSWKPQKEKTLKILSIYEYLVAIIPQHDIYARVRAYEFIGLLNYLIGNSIDGKHFMNMVLILDSQGNTNNFRRAKSALVHFE